MKTAHRMFELASARPSEALGDVVGLLAICVLLFAGFAATAIA